MSVHERPFTDLAALAAHLRQELEKRKFILLYAYNSTGKTRLSTKFKNIGKDGDERDTLYFNAFTEDLFYWDNDLENDRERVLKFNRDSRFFDGLDGLEMDNRIGPLLERYADFYFRIDVENWQVSFSRDVITGEGVQARSTRLEDIKISRGEESIFIWCFFLALVQLVIDDDGAGPYSWVKYIYIDDPISSLDEANAIAVANHLAQMLKQSESGPRTVISTHHGLFFNVLSNELMREKVKKYFFKNGSDANEFTLVSIKKGPFLQHMNALVSLYEAQGSGELKRHHFNMLRSIMEQTAIFFGFEDWKKCIQANDGGPDKALSERIINVMSHGDYLILEPEDLAAKYKDDFAAILKRFITDHPFNPALFESSAE